MDDFKPWPIGIPMIQYGIVALIIVPSGIAIVLVLLLLTLLTCCKFELVGEDIARILVDFAKEGARVKEAHYDPPK